MAGLLIHEKIAQDTHAAFHLIYDSFRLEHTDKLHIADLSPSQQGDLRNQIYSTIVSLDLPCFWYALHVEGLHRYYAEFQELLPKYRPATSPRFKRGSPRENPPLLHEKLFEGLLCNVLAFLEEYHIESVALRIMTDPVDASTSKRFKMAVEHFLDDSPLETRSTALDTETNQIVAGLSKIEIHWPDWLRLTVEVNELAVECVEDGTTLAADVLANSLNHLFIHRSPNELYGPLNDAVAIKRHPIAEHFRLFNNPLVGDLVGDRLLAHPSAPNPL